MRSVAQSTRSLDTKNMNIQLELEKAQQLAQQHQQEVERLRVKIREVEEELKRQKDQYLRKSSTKAVSQLANQAPDPELDRMRSYIRQLEEEIAEMKRQLAQASQSQRDVIELKKQLEHAESQLQGMRSNQQQIQQQPNNNMRQSQAISAAKSFAAPSMYSAGVQKVDDVQERILQELNYLKGNPEVLNKPGTSHGIEIDRLRKEKDALIEENRKLKTMINEDSAAPTSGNTKYLKNKVIYSILIFLDLPP